MTKELGQDDKQLLTLIRQLDTRNHLTGIMELLFSIDFAIRIARDGPGRKEN